MDCVIWISINFSPLLPLLPPQEAIIMNLLNSFVETIGYSIFIPPELCQTGIQRLQMRSMLHHFATFVTKLNLVDLEKVCTFGRAQAFHIFKSCSASCLGHYYYTNFNYIASFYILICFWYLFIYLFIYWNVFLLASLSIMKSQQRNSYFVQFSQQYEKLTENPKQ